MTGPRALRVLVVCPLAFEAAAARVALKRARLVNAAEVIVTGPGPHTMSERLAQALDGLTERPLAAVLFGTCGSLHAGAAAQGPAPRIDCIMDQHGARWAPTLAGPKSSEVSASVVSVPFPVMTPYEKRACFDACRADLVDCESAAFAARCDASDIPWAVVRGVSDAWNHSLPASVVNWVSPSGKTRPARVAIDLLRSPSLIPPTIALGTRSRKALLAAGQRLTAIIEHAMLGASGPANNPVA